MKALNQFIFILIRRFAHFLNSIAHIYMFSLLFFSLHVCLRASFSVLILFFPSSSFSSVSLSPCFCLEIHDTDKNGVNKLKEMETNFEHLEMFIFPLVFHFVRISLCCSCSLLRLWFCVFGSFCLCRDCCGSSTST